MSQPSGFMQYLCSQLQKVMIMFAFGLVGMVLNTISLFYVGPRSVIIVGMNYVGLIVMLLGTGFVIWRCRQL